MDWIAGIVTVIGMWLIMKKIHWGFVLMILNEGLWFHILYQNPETHGLLIPTFLMTGIYIKGFIEWRKDGNKNKLQ